MWSEGQHEPRPRRSKSGVWKRGVRSIVSRGVGRCGSGARPKIDPYALRTPLTRHMRGLPYKPNEVGLTLLRLPSPSVLISSIVSVPEPSLSAWLKSDIMSEIRSMLAPAALSSSANCGRRGVCGRGPRSRHKVGIRKARTRARATRMRMYHVPTSRLQRQQAKARSCKGTLVMCGRGS